MQIVMLSTRPSVLRGSLAHVARFMPWIDSVVIVTPARLADRGWDTGALPVEIATDEELTGLDTHALAALDHMARNFAIRGGLATHKAVSDEFVMADDDARPLKPVGLDQFVDGSRHRSYFFYDLDAWPADDTPFDRGQHNAREMLAFLGYGRLAFGSHMPQIIRKDHLAEAWAVAERLTATPVVCEWAWYFNVSQALHPDDYAEPEPFLTLCWPQYRHEWPYWIRPAEYVFENFYPELYETGHLFEGIPTELTDDAERHNVEKILRWSEFGRRTAELDFDDAVANPWADTPGRRAAFGVLRRLRKAYDYVSLPERDQIAELQGTIRRMETEISRLQSEDGA